MSTQKKTYMKGFNILGDSAIWESKVLAEASLDPGDWKLQM